jgi:hypothetical protein
MCRCPSWYTGRRASYRLGPASKMMLMHALLSVRHAGLQPAKAEGNEISAQDGREMLVVCT